MAGNENRVLWKFFANTKSLDKGLKDVRSGFKETEKQTSKFDAAIGGAKRAIGALGLAMGGREILRWGLDAVDAANDFEESVNALQVTTGDAAGEILKLGEDAAEAFAMSGTELNEAAVRFSAFAKQIDDEDVAGTFEDYTTRAADFASVMNISVNEAMEKFQSGLAGESEPLRAFGLDMSAATVTAYAYATGIAKVGETLTEQEKVQARYGLLMEQTSNTQGDFANTADSAANKTKILNAKLADMRVEIGRKLQPAYADLLTVAEASIPALVGVASAAAEATGALGSLAQGAADASEEGKSLWGRMGDVMAATTRYATYLPYAGVLASEFADRLDRIGESTERMTGGAERMDSSFRSFDYLQHAAGMRSIGDAADTAAGQINSLAQSTRDASRAASLWDVSRFTESGVVTNVNDAQIIRDLIELGAITGDG